MLDTYLHSKERGASNCFRRMDLHGVKDGRLGKINGCRPGLGPRDHTWRSSTQSGLANGTHHHSPGDGRTTAALRCVAASLRRACVLGSRLGMRRTPSSSTSSSSSGALSGHSPASDACLALLLSHRGAKRVGNMCTSLACSRLICPVPGPLDDGLGSEHRMARLDGLGTVILGGIDPS